MSAVACAVLVDVRPDNYQVELFDGSGIRRYLTDHTLPEELKWKLGMLMFGLDDDEVGYKVHGDNRYVIKITDKTLQTIQGLRDDAGSKGQG
jgi:hypothetical protein